MDKIVHFEITADDTERAKKFYTKTFGWEMNSIPSLGYTIVTTGPTDDKRMPKETGFINGGMMKRTDKIKNPVLTINVENIDAAIKNVIKNGGKLIMDKMNVGTMGIAAYFSDTEGNILGLWQALT